MRGCDLFVYRFDRAQFRPHLEEAGYWTSKEDVRPVSIEPAGDLLTCHAKSGIEFRVVPDLWPLIDAVVASGLRFSIIRRANARPRATPPA
jgi:hypothetical protein